MKNFIKQLKTGNKQKGASPYIALPGHGDHVYTIGLLTARWQWSLQSKGNLLQHTITLPTVQIVTGQKGGFFYLNKIFSNAKR